MSEPKPMSPLEKIKALKAEAEAKKSREAQEAAERAAKEQNEKQEKLLEARKKFGEAQKLVEECTATYNETAEEMKGIEDTELLGQISAIVEESRAAMESAQATLREASDALENLEKLGSNEVIATEQQVQEKNERYLHEEDYESKVSARGDTITLFQKENDFAKVLRGEKEGLLHPEEAARAVRDINELAHDYTKRTQEFVNLKKDVEKYLETLDLKEIYKMRNNAKTNSEKRAVLDKIKEKVAEVDEYLYRMVALFHSTDPSLSHNSFTIPEEPEDPRNKLTLEGLTTGLTVINYEQMKKLSSTIYDLRVTAVGLINEIHRDTP